MSGHPSQGSINLRDFLQLKYQVNNRELIAKKAITPLISIVDDDGNAQFVEKYEDIIRTKNVPITCAFVTSRVDLEFYLSTTQVNYCINELGVEFISHTHTDRKRVV